jgi:hypothetical protein
VSKSAAEFELDIAEFLAEKPRPAPKKATARDRVLAAAEGLVEKPRPARNKGPARQRVKLPRYNARKGAWKGGDSRTLYAFGDPATGGVRVVPGGYPMLYGPQATVRIATRDEAEQHWQHPLVGWKVAESSVTSEAPRNMPGSQDEEWERLRKRRYMLVDAKTGKDMRQAYDFEVKRIQSLSRSGEGGLELRGGHYDVRLRDMDEQFSVVRDGKILAAASSIAGAMALAPPRGNVVVRGEYRSDGRYWAAGEGRVVAQRENGRWVQG